VQLCLEKQSKWGVWQSRYIRIHNFALFYGSKETELKNITSLNRAEKHLEETGSLREPTTDLTIIPLEVVRSINFKKEKVILAMNPNGVMKRKNLVFRAPSKNPYDALKIVNSMKTHLDLYRKAESEKISARNSKW